MSIDSATKRFSMMDMDQPFEPAMPVADGVLDVGGRFNLLWLYAFLPKLLGRVVLSGSKTTKMLRGSLNQ